MSHVDEGTLHAYLDGALEHLGAAEAARVREHLARCPECAGRLEEEREVRREAEALLTSTAVDAGPLPDFEALRTRAERGRPGTGSRLRTLGLAASLVLAVGTGWFLRGGLPAPRDVAAPSVAPSASASAPAQEPPAVEPPAVEPPAETSPAAERPASPSPEAGRLADAARPPAEATGSPALAEDRGAAESPQAAPPTPVEPVRTDREAGQRVGALRAGVSLDEAERARAPAVAAEAARSESGAGALLAVPGYPVLEVASSSLGHPPGTVRVLQLVLGDTLELLHFPPGGAAPELTLPDGEGRVQVVRYGPRGWVVAKGPFSRERLEALLDRLLEGG